MKLTYSESTSAHSIGGEHPGRIRRMGDFSIGRMANMRAQFSRQARKRAWPAVSRLARPFCCCSDVMGRRILAVARNCSVPRHELKVELARSLREVDTPTPLRLRTTQK